MEFNGVTIEDTYAEGFPVWTARVIITAVTKDWAYKAATEATGFATSTIGCPCEAGIEKFLPPEQTPDHRPGFAILICCGKKALKEQVLERVSECILTAPTTAVFNGHAGEDEIIPIKLHFFGEKLEKQVEVGGIKCWSIPIMGGDFIVEEEIGAVKGVAGCNFLILGESQMSALIAAEAAVDAIRGVAGTITPFPGGVVSSGSKVGSLAYKFMNASTNEKFCPTIRAAVLEKGLETQIPEGVKAVYEIVIDGVSEAAVKEAMKAGVQAACRVPGVVKITAGNYGGNLGPFKFMLKDCI